MPMSRAFVLIGFVLLCGLGFLPPGDDHAPALLPKSVEQPRRPSSRDVWRVLSPAPALAQVDAIPEKKEKTEKPAQAITLPLKLETRAGIELLVLAETTGKKVRWQSLDPALRIIPPDSTDKQVWVIAGRAGAFDLQAWTAFGDEPTAAVRRTVLVAGSDPDIPTPPVPPTPIPPDAGFIAKLQTAYDADAASATIKRDQRAMLSGFYTGMAQYTKKADIPTLGKLLEDMLRESKAMVPEGALREVRLAIKNELVTALGDDPDSAMTPELRRRAVDVYGHISAALDKLK